MFEGDGLGLFATEFEAVVLAGVVGGGQHRPGRVAVLADREVEGVGRDQAEIDRVGPLVPDPVDQGPGQRRPGDAHVPPDRDLVRFEVDDEGAADLVQDLRRQLVGDDAADVVGLEQGGDGFGVLGWGLV